MKRVARARLTRFELAAAGLYAAGLGMRLLAFSHRRANWEGMGSLTMGRSLAERGEFVRPWFEGAPHTQPFPPMDPALDAVAYALAGPSCAAALFRSAPASVPPEGA